jgi:hypothetical protein
VPAGSRSCYATRAVAARGAAGARHGRLDLRGYAAHAAQAASLPHDASPQLRAACRSWMATTACSPRPGVALLLAAPVLDRLSSRPSKGARPPATARGSLGARSPCAARSAARRPGGGSARLSPSRPLWSRSTRVSRVPETEPSPGARAARPRGTALPGRRVWPAPPAAVLLPCAGVLWRRRWSSWARAGGGRRARRDLDVGLGDSPGSRPSVSGDLHGQRRPSRCTTALPIRPRPGDGLRRSGVVDRLAANSRDDVAGLAPAWPPARLDLGHQDSESPKRYFGAARPLEVRRACAVRPAANKGCRRRIVPVKATVGRARARGAAGAGRIAGASGGSGARSAGPPGLRLRRGTQTLAAGPQAQRRRPRRPRRQLQVAPRPALAPACAPDLLDDAPRELAAPRTP